jgi:hypothetical protein
MEGKRSRPSFGTMIAVIALFVALGGTATALHSKAGGGTSAKSSGLKTLNIGQNKTVLKNGPISFKAFCTDSGGNPHVNLELKSSQSGTVVDTGGGGGSVVPGGGAAWVDVTNAGTSWAGFNFNVAAPNGATLTGHGSAGVNIGGHDCAAVVSAISHPG